MNNTPNYNNKIQTLLAVEKPGERTCEISGQTWEMDQYELDLYKRFNIPVSKRSPLTRIKNVTGFGYGLNFWWHKHALTGKPIITYVHPSSGLKVVSDAEFFEQDHTDKATEYDPSKPFMDQIRALQLQVPYPAQRNIVAPENSLTIASFGDENSYFTIGCKSKNTLYAIVSQDIENSAEILHSNSITDSFRVVSSNRIFNGRSVYHSSDCMNSAFMFDCRNCENCFGSWNKRNKQYLWWNEQLSKEEWEKRRAEVDLGDQAVFEKMRKRFEETVNTQAVWPENFNEHADNCVGEYLNKCRDCRYVYVGNNGPSDNFYGVYYSGQSERNAFMGGASDSQDNYSCHAPYRSKGCKFVHNCINSQNLEYCIQCYDCENCFASVGLVRKKFCIFNKQYTESEYWKKLDELKYHLLETGEYGEFFPLSFSPSYVPLATNMVYLTTNKEQEALGAVLFDPDSDGAFGEGVNADVFAKPEEVDQSIGDIDTKELSKTVFMDTDEKRPFTLLAPEIELYKKLNVFPKAEHPVSRMRKLMLSANSAVFEKAQCVQCKKEIEVAKNVTYQNRKLHCRDCYLKDLEKNG
ncbi:MAG: hypothetical protein ABIH21_00900 [Patescibacteria group bacterium]